MPLHVSSQFDGGNIVCLACAAPDDIRLEIAKDGQAEFCQWFYFRLTGARGEDCRLKIMNAGGASYEAGWRDYRAVASYDREDWFRVETGYEGGVLTIRHRPEFDSVYYAYFAPFSMERHADLIAAAQGSALVRLHRLGASLDGQDIDLLEIGAAAPDKKACWAIARQHPGETMAEWWMEGFLERLLDEDDPVARALLERAVFHVVPNMNPDGSRRGHLRTNAAGANLNREWQDPSLARSPEIFLVRQRMTETGVDVCLDVHGDEALAYNFIAGAEGIASWSEAKAARQQTYKAALMLANPDFQCEKGYPKSAPGKANMTMCTNYVAETFGALAMTLEMPFKDAAGSPDEVAGWSPERCRKLGSSCLDALYRTIDDLDG